jgi:hypothetical protein
MAYVKKSYVLTQDDRYISFSGHIKPETALKNGYQRVTLKIIDMSGRGRGEARTYCAPDFIGMKPFN